MATWELVTCPGGHEIRSKEDGTLILPVGNNLTLGKQLVAEHNVHKPLVDVAWKVMAKAICSFAAAEDELRHNPLSSRANERKRQAENTVAKLDAILEHVRDGDGRI
ncbi:MAG: hypothetical protein LUE17_05900 [Planctomycetaceae bacterium]|nr:hypothetical protein [Planctomycetaceae bacterium]